MNISNTNKVEDIIKVPSKGIEAYYNQQRVLIGSLDFLNENGIDTSKASHKLEEYRKIHCKPIFLSIDGNLTGIICNARYYKT